MGKELVWLIGALVVFVLVIGVVIPTTVTLASSFDSQGTATGETWVGTASTAHAMTYSPIVSVTDFRKSINATTAVNTTDISGNASDNVSETFTFSSIFDDGTVTGAKYDLNYTTVVGAGSNVSVYVGSKKIAELTTTNVWTALGRVSTEVESGIITFVFNGENVSYVDNVSIRYQHFNTSTAYTLASASGQITPTASGGYYTTYTYGTGVTGGTLAIVLVLPLMIAAVLLILFIRSSGML